MYCKYIVVIPARGGSKRLPRKNILDLAGIPLICHSIFYAKREIPQIPIFVSSDDEGILSLAETSDTIPIRRPDELAGDYSTTAAVLKHASKWIQDRGYKYEYMILLQCTNPLRPDGLINEAINLIDKNCFTSLLSVSSVIEKLGKIVDNKFVPWNYTFGQRSQELEPLYKENGLIYISHKDLIEQGKIIDNNTFPMIVDHVFSSIDIDTIEDFKKAEYFLIKKNE